MYYIIFSVMSGAAPGSTAITFYRKSDAWDYGYAHMLRFPYTIKGFKIYKIMKSTRQLRKEKVKLIKDMFQRFEDLFGSPSLEWKVKRFDNMYDLSLPRLEDVYDEFIAYCGVHERKKSHNAKI